MQVTPEILQSYARLIVRSGANVRPGQTVQLTISVDLAPFARMLTQECYLAGARKVNVDWNCDAISRLHFQYASEETLSAVLPWQEAKGQADGGGSALPHLHRLGGSGRHGRHFPGKALRRGPGPR